MTDQLSPGHMQALEQALAEGKKLQAIKIYRAATGEGLKETKDYLDALIPKLVEQDPQRYAKLASAQNRGCLFMLFVVISAIGGLGLLVAMTVSH